MTRYLTPLAVLILILTLASLGVLFGASPAYANHSAPTGLSVTGGTTDSISLDWSDYPRNPRAIRQYRVRVYDSAGTLLSTHRTGGKTSAYTVTGLSPSTDYQFAVAVQFGVGHVSNYSSRVGATTDAATPNPPSSVVYVAPREGAQVSGVTPVRVRAPAGTAWIGVYACGGKSVGEDLVIDANGEWSVQWDTRICPNGQQGLDTWAFRDDGSNLGNAVIDVTVQNEHVTVQNEPQPPPPPPSPPSPSGEPGPIAGQGYSRVFADEFATFDRTVWCSNQWWEPNPPLGTEYVQDGVLHVLSRRSDGYPNVTVSSEPCGQANPKSFKQGYIEARFRWTAGNGSSPAFWLFSTRHATNPSWPNVSPYCAQNGLPVAECYSGELDVFEGQGHQPSTFIGSMHRNSCGCYGVANQLRQGVPTVDTGVNMTTGFHTYSVLWTRTEVRWYLDEVLLGSAQPFDSLNQPMHLLFYQWPQSWTRDTDASTPNELHTEVDWVRVWQK
jgi:hypothetical protein